MNRSAAPRDDGERFVRDYFDDDASSSAPRSPRSDAFDSRFEERRRWARTALASFGSAAVAGVLFAVAGASWATWSSFVQTAFLVAAVLVAHGAGAFVERRGERLWAHFLYCLGAATFLGGVWALFVGADAPRRLALWASALPTSTLLVFATAQTSRSRSLHFIAALSFVVAFALDDGSRLVFAFRFADWAVVCCALGEYWAWRRSSLSVATVYFGVCVWTLVALLFATPFSFDARSLILIGAFGLFLRWFGAAYRSAFGATLGVFVALFALGLAAFPYFWLAFFTSNGAAPFGFDAESSATVEAVFASALFVVFSIRLIFDGARRNIVQFALAVAAFAFWLLAQCGAAALGFEASRWSAAPPTVAALVFAALLFKILTERSDAPRSPSPSSSNAVVLSDALSDDRDLDDLFDAEARAGTQTPRLSPSVESFDAFFEHVVRRRFLAYVASVLAQAVALVVFARLASRF